MKTLTISDETYEKIKGQIKEDTKKIEIKNIDGDVIYTSSKPTLKEAVEEAVGCKANLCGADLYKANLSGADLSEANLSKANLYGADLCGANLSKATLYGADLYGVNLSGANLSGANLSKAELCRANLRGANLSRAELCRAKFYGQGGEQKLTKKQVPEFLEALGFEII